MGNVDQAGGSRIGWDTTLWRLAASPQTPAVAGTLLAVLAAVQALLGSAGRNGVGGGAPQITLVLLAVSTVLPLGFGWGYPAVAAVAVCAACVACMLAFHTLPVAGLAALLILLYRLGRGGSQSLAAVLTLPFLVLALAGHGSKVERISVVLLAVLGPAAAWAGAARRARNEAALHSAARQAIAGSLVEHTVRGERARVSHELHDVVAHHISMIAVQAETARLATPGMPEAGAQQLLAIGDTARSALTEMRRLLGVLREDTRTTAPVRQPQPGLRQLNELLDEARNASEAGIRLIVHGAMTPLDPGVELAAYRIVQEALTNARRHAAGAAVDVELHYAGDTLRLRVRDNGPGPPPASRSPFTAPPDVSATTVPPSGGHGLLGMRERAAAAGGDLRTGTAAGGGFVVEATLPVTAEAAA
jgi:signal transduction histidine kinase